MALITCTECNNQVSSKAAACPNCGAPIGSESAAAGASLTTTQVTSKKLKLHNLLSIIMFWSGMIGSYFTMKSHSTIAPIETNFWFYTLFIGVTWYLYTKMKIWWHHK